MARRILHVIGIGLLWHLFTIATSSVISSGSISRSSKNGRPILAMANSPRCIYNGKPVEDGRQVSSPEPCLNCTCSKGVLLCYLHTCPSVVVPSPECYVAREEGHCCPEVFCKVASGAKVQATVPEAPYQRSDDQVPSKRRTTPEDVVDSMDLLPVLLKRNHNKAASAVQTTLTPGSDASSEKFTPPFIQSNHRPGGTARDRPHYKGRSTIAATTESGPSPATESRKIPPLHVPAVQLEPATQEPEKIVYDLRLGASPNLTKSNDNSNSTNTTTSCYVGGFMYLEGMAMLSTSKCEYCYCIRGHQMCVRPKCHLKIDGCEARYHSGFTCCPSHYHCEAAINRSSADLIDNHSSQTETPGFTQSFSNKGVGCAVEGHVFDLGVAVPSRGHCQTCYCTQVGVVCRRLECAPRVDGCEPVVPDGHCCPKEYSCGVPGTNTSEGLVSHSTDNYEVKVFSPQSSAKIPQKIQSNPLFVAPTAEDRNSTTADGAKDVQKVTIHIKGTSHLEKVSILPNENLAILVVTTEEINGNDNEEHLAITGAPDLLSKKSKPHKTVSVPKFTTQAPSSVEELKSPETTDKSGTLSRITVSGIKGKITSQSSLDASSTQVTTERISKHTGGNLYSTSSGIVNGGTEYYYEDDYDYNQDYIYDYKRPAERATTVSDKLNEPTRAQTFSPFSVNDELAFGERINQNKRRPDKTTLVDEILIPSMSQIDTNKQTTKYEFQDYTTAVEYPIGSNYRPANFDQKPSEVNINNHKQEATNQDHKTSNKINTGSKVQATVFELPEDESHYETTAADGQSEFIADIGTVFQETYFPSVGIDVTDPDGSSGSTTKRQSPALSKFALDQISNIGYTASLDYYRHPVSMTHSFNQKGIPTQKPHSVATEDIIFHVPTRSHRPISTKAPGVKRPQITISHPIQSDLITFADYSVTEAPPANSDIKIVNNALPKDIAELLWSLTESTSQSNYDDNSSFTEEMGTVNPTDDAQEIVASPKLILQSNSAKKDHHISQGNPTVVTTGASVFNVKKRNPPQIVFSNHRPSVVRRPLPSVHTTHLQTTVNNHKNSLTAFSIPVRPKTTTEEPLLEFSNHKPVTSTPFRPQFTAETHETGSYRPNGNAIKYRLPPYKLHRVIPENETRKAGKLHDDIQPGENFASQTDSENLATETTKLEELLFGFRTGYKPFGQNRQTLSGNKVTPSMRWNDASTNPVTVGFDVRPDFYETQPETQATEHEQLKTNEPIATHSVSDNYTTEASSLSEHYSVEVSSQTITESPMKQSGTVTSSNISTTGDDYRVTDATSDTEAASENLATLTENGHSKNTAIIEVEAESVTNSISTESTSSEYPVYSTADTISYDKNPQNVVELRNNVFSSKESIELQETKGKNQSAPEKPIKTDDYYNTAGSNPLLESATNYNDKHDKDENSGHQQTDYNRLKEGTVSDKNQPSKVGPNFQPNVAQNGNASGNESKLYRAEEGHRDPTSSLIDRLIPYGASHDQRLPPVRPYAVLPERKTTTTPSPQVTPTDEKEIGDVCFMDGRYYKSGEVIVKSNPCELCRCFYGHPLCQVQQCPSPPGPHCILEYLPGYCCPRVTCGVKLDGLRPPSDVNSIYSPQNDVRPPSITMDNQWKPVESPRPPTSGLTRNVTVSGSLPADTVSVSQKNQTTGTGNILKTPMEVVEGSLRVSGVSEGSYKDPSISNKSKTETDEDISPHHSVEMTSNSQPKPVFDPSSIKKPSTDTKKEATPAIHDNSSGVRKILTEAVILPPSKMSVSPHASADVNPVLPSIHARTSATHLPTNQTATPSVDHLMEGGGLGLENLPAELGGNLKVSGCNVYGKYYKIHDQVTALSKACTECICSPDGISCNSIC